MVYSDQKISAWLMLIFTSWGSSPVIWSVSNYWQNSGSFFSQLGQRNLSPTETGLAAHTGAGGPKCSCSSSMLARKELAVDPKPVLCLTVLYWEANKCPWEGSGGHLPRWTYSATETPGLHLLDKQWHPVLYPWLYPCLLSFGASKWTGSSQLQKGSVLDG